MKQPSSDRKPFIAWNSQAKSWPPHFLAVVSWCSKVDGETLWLPESSTSREMEKGTTPPTWLPKAALHRRTLIANQEAITDGIKCSRKWVSCAIAFCCVAPRLRNAVTEFHPHFDCGCVHPQHLWPRNLLSATAADTDIEGLYMMEAAYCTWCTFQQQQHQQQQLAF